MLVCLTFDLLHTTSKTKHASYWFSFQIAGNKNAVEKVIAVSKLRGVGRDGIFNKLIRSSCSEDMNPYFYAE